MRDHRAIFRQIYRSSATSMAAANSVGAVIAVLNLTAGDGEFSADDILSMVLAAGYMVVVTPLATFMGWRRTRPSLIWLAEGRDPTAAECRRLLDLPASNALALLTYWAGAALLFFPMNVFVFENPLSNVVNLILGIVLAGLATCAVAYLLMERLLRPAIALAFAATPSVSSPLGLQRRLMLTWGLATAVPLLSIGLIYITGTGDPPAMLVAFDVVLGLLVGWYLMRRAALSVTEPLAQVRQVLDAVERDRLNVTTQVTDGGDVGLLQAGVNRMVGGLRERRRLHDLFGRHVGAEVAARAVADGVELGGVRCQASAMFVDVIGSTSLAQRLEAEELVALLNEFFETVVRTVGTEGGWVNKFEGDGAMCVFGAPVEQHDHAARALRAAANLRSALKGMSGLDAAIGLSSGEVIAGNVGSVDRMEYTVMGDPVNEAARLSDAAKGRPGRVLASQAAIDAADVDGWQPAGEFELRGRASATTAWEPTGG